MDTLPEQRNQVLESLIRHEEVRMLYGSMHFSNLATVVASVIMFATLYGHVDSTRSLVFWVAIMLLLVVIRGWDTLQYIRSSAAKQKQDMWGHRFLAGASFAGCWWGMLSWLGHSSENAYQALTVVCIIGVASGSMSTLSYRWKTIAYFLVPALGLLELRLLFENDAFSTTISFLLLVFILFTLSTSRKIYKNTNQNVRLRIEADFRERALIEAKEEAERANHAKSSFLSSMSHDLRTPLNAILGFSQLLEYDKSINNSQRTHILEISAAGKHLLDLVNQILDLSKIEDGSMRFNIKQVSLEEVLSACHSLIKPLANEKQIQLHFDTCTGGFIKADQTRLKQVLLNLLSNAIKYNHHFGSVSLRCSVPASNRIRITVEDTGQGIPANMQHRLFQPFNRLEHETSRIEGTGIGLSIARHLTKMMGGNIGFSSEIANGSTFWIELEGTISEHANISPPLQDVNTGASQPMISSEQNNSIKILVVEDNVTNRKLIVSQLNMLGYTSDLASNGQDALAMYKKHHYAMILTDCNMPVMDGYRLATTIRRSGDSNTPIIALTADAFPESEIRCRASGMSDRMVKPVTLKTLKTTLKKWQPAEAGS
jgi:signal transduction histidine kinase/CheY-like chemotaxis protein